MSALALDAAWRAALLARARQAPAAAREPLRWRGRAFGSIEPALPIALAGLRAADGGDLLCREDAGWSVRGEPTDGLRRLADALRAAGLAHVWRDEQLAVCDAHGVSLATVERAVVRVLGIATQAVYLVGFDPRGHVWLQQRAHTKANDPGLWDTLVGGMVGAGDTLQAALERETWEEAGLRLATLPEVRHGGVLHLRCPANDGTRHSYLVEDIHWSRCLIPAGVTPCNQDGEVDRFECVPAEQVVARMHQGLVTGAAAMIFIEALGL